MNFDKDAIFQKLAHEMASLIPHVASQAREDWLESVLRVAAEDSELLDECTTLSERSQAIEHRAMKSIQRLTSFGGTDLGILYMDHIGEYYPFPDDDGLPKDAVSVVKSKQCVSTPSPTNGDMRRGIVLEPAVRKAFEARMAPEGFKMRADLFGIFTKLYTDRIPEHPWLCGMPDGIYEDAKGKIHLVDFKVPADPDRIEAMEYKPPTMYVAQLATYEAILNRHGIDVEQCWLAPLSIKTMDTDPIPITMPDRIIDTLMELGDSHWDHVTQGTLPFKEKKAKDFESRSSFSDETLKVIARSIYYNRVASLAEKEKKSDIKLLSYMARAEGFDVESGGSKKRIPGYTVSTATKTSFKQQKAIRLLEDMGIDPKDPKYGLYEESTSLTFRVAKKDGLVSRIESEAGEVIEDGIYDLEENERSYLSMIDRDQQPKEVKEDNDETLAPTESHYPAPGSL